MRALPRDFYLRPTDEVARDLLGRTLVRRIGRRRLALRIVEVEAYLGVEDPAAHTYRGRRTARVAPMWGPGGHAYVYRSYGMHDLFNVVTREAGTPQAVLVRAGEPLEGERAMLERRPGKRSFELARGPACLCRALDVDRRHTGLDLVARRTLWLEEGAPVAERDVQHVPRVGVDYAGEAAAWPLRFIVKDHPSVSVAPRRP